MKGQKDRIGTHTHIYSVEQEPSTKTPTRVRSAYVGWSKKTPPQSRIEVVDVDTTESMLGIEKQLHCLEIS